MSDQEEQNSALIALIADVAELKAALQLQKDINAELLRRLYGRSSEKVDPAQLLLLLQEDGAAKKPDAAGDPQGPAAESKAPKKPRRRPVQRLRDSMRTLPTVEREILPPEVEADPDTYRRIGQEVSERLHVTPASYTRHVTIRPTFVRKDTPADAIPEAPITASLPTPLLEGSVLTPSLAAQLLTEKFVYHQPFYRQEWRLERAHGIHLTRNLMCHWHDHLADTLQPLYNLIVEDLCRSNYLKVDETPIRYLDPGIGKTSTGQLWVYHHAGHGALYDWHTSRAHTCLEPVLGGDPDNALPAFRGHLQSDGLRAYQTYIATRPTDSIVPVSCLAHIRRKFESAIDDHPRITAWILRCIARIYQIESALRKGRASSELRKEIRAGEIRRQYDHLIRLVAHLAGRRSITPASKLGKALGYARGQLPHLKPCFEDGQIEFDNNLTENAVRPTKLGAKNWMFIGGADTGQRSAIVYTFVEQVRRLGKDPFVYLQWVFERLPGMTNQDDLRDLLPKAWGAQQQARFTTSEAAAA